ncbi:amino acid synthesis family protein [Bosea sp. NBC_00550]|uniref:amino acid synthesis family protein n=1 Tax=Bosea sp. NBC_00550 TaxID=2969621 RepID=UPI002232A8C5|nr:amino acid synthesis family protein [Bosea sp. NBC_00550]UZF95546.1 amino acid synthesis family protein [Bosea sp. NBC_00550]
MKDLIRKFAVSSEEVLIEGGRAVSKPYRTSVVAAVIRNPWAGRGFVEDLQPEIMSIAPELGAKMVPRLLEAIGGAEAVEAYGKAAVVGVSGEVEHASALIHTLRFGNALREAVKGVSYLNFTNKRAGPGTSIDVPLTHINTLGKRSHFLTASIVIPDAPGADELVIAIGAATSGRPHARIGDRYEDMKAMGVDQTNTKVPA